MNAAATRFDPALMWIGGVLIVTPVTDSTIFGSISSSATRSPSIDTSTCSPSAVPPNSTPQAFDMRSIRKM